VDDLAPLDDPAYDAALKRADAKDAVLADVLRTLAGKAGA
jgi:hypothetical protein